MIDKLLADLLKGQGRTEQAIKDLTREVQQVGEDHEQRIRKLESRSLKFTSLVAGLSAGGAWLMSIFKHKS